MEKLITQVFIEMLNTLDGGDTFTDLIIVDAGE